MSKRITYLTEGNRLEIRVSIKHWGLVALLLLIVLATSIGSFFALALALVDLIGGQAVGRGIRLLAIFMASFALQVSAFLTLLWLLFGEEVVTVWPGALQVREDLFGTGETRNFLAVAVTDMRPAGFLEGIDWRLGSQNRLRRGVAFTYAGRKQLFGVRLREMEAIEVISRIEAHLEGFKRKRRRAKLAKVKTESKAATPVGAAAKIAVAGLGRKLRIKPGNRILIMNAPDDYPRTLGELPKNVSVSTSADGEFDVIQAFFTRKAEVDKQVEVLKTAMGKSGILWICYPKGTSKTATDLNRDILRAHLADLGMQAAGLVAVDGTWSALRLKKK